MKKIIIVLASLFFIAACELENNIKDDLKGDAVIAGQLSYRDTLNGNGAIRPLAGKKIFISYPDGDSLNYIYHVLTDSNGNFTFKRLNSGKQYLVFFSDSVDHVKLSVYDTVTAPQDKLELLAQNDAFRQNAMLFYIVNAEGEPLKDVETGLFNNKEVFDSDTTNKLSIAKVSTDQYGRAVFYDFKAGKYYVRAKTSNEAGRISGEKTIEFSGSGIRKDTIFLQTSPVVKNTLQVRTVDEAGNVLPKIKVCTFNNPLLFGTDACDGSMRSDSTGADGMLKINNVLPAAYYLYAKTTQNNTDYVGKATATVQESGATSIDLVMKKVVPNELLVRVVDESGNPLPDITVCLFNNPLQFNTQSCERHYKTGSTKQDGKISFPGIPGGNYYLYAGFELNNIKYKGMLTTFVNAAGQTVADLVLRKEVSAYELEITTVDPDGTPVNDTKLYFFTSRVLWSADTTLGFSYEKNTGKNGKGLITDMEEGKYYIRARVMVGGQVVMKGADSVTIAPSPVRILKTVRVQ